MERKVLFTASTASHIRNFHLPYLQQFGNDGWTVHVACAGMEEDIPFAHKVLSVPFEKKMLSPGNLRAAALLRRVVADERYELVITHTSLAAFFTRLALKAMPHRPRVINVAHGYLFGAAGNSAAKDRLLSAAEALVAPQTDLLLTMNQWDDSYARKHHLAPEIRMIPGIGVDFVQRCTPLPDARTSLRSRYGIPNDAFVLFYAAEFSHRKNQTCLIDAMEFLPDNVFLVLAGTGELCEACCARAKAMPCGRRILFLGYCTDVASWYAASDAAVTSSRSEGLPFNLMEAMYCALPVVASNVKGHSDLVQQDCSGLLYPCDDAAACAHQILRLMQDPVFARKLGENAHQSVQPYALSAVLPTVMAAYGV